MWTAIYAEIGAAPIRPQKAGLNPFLLYQKDYWAKCREQCDEARRASSKNPNARAARDEIRAALGQMWRKAPPAEKQPYVDQVDTNRRTNDEQWERWKTVVTEWERRSYEVKDQWCAQNPFAEWEAPQSGLD
jgi:lysine-specific histone demethylase 1